MIISKAQRSQREKKEKHRVKVPTDSHLKQAEEKIIKLNHLYSFISHTNQTIVHVKDEQTLFDQACSIAVNKGKFKMAWIGIANPLIRKIKLTASCAASASDLRMLNNYSYDKDGPIEKVLLGLEDYIITNIQQNE